MRRFAQIDVFGDGDGDGNPLAVVIDGDGLSSAQMQRFATWMNLAETTFLLTPSEPEADYRGRIFTTTRELPFAGHPTLRSGPLDAATLAEVTATLGIAEADIVAHAWTDNGPGWASVLLHDADGVLALTPHAPCKLDIGVVGLHPDGTPELRAFIPGSGVSEDPVTGSLNAGVAQWLLDSGRLRAPYVARQGTALGRRGRIYVDRDALGRIWIGGRTVTRIDGTAVP